MFKKHKLFIPPEGPPQNIKPNPEIYAIMGEEAIFNMISDFYDLLALSPIHSMFSSDKENAVKRSASFFIFILGGPPLYHQKYGHPMMRQRHMPFEIDEKARQIWLDCFHQILNQAEEKYGFPKEHMESFWNFLTRFSSWMVNSR